MTYTLTVSYPSCQSCHAKIYCEECEKRLEESLMRMQGIHGASIQLVPKQVIICASVDMDTLEENLEDLGLFLA